MSFLNPFFLLGLIAVGIPLLIHLINLRRPEKIRFSTLVFFEALQTSALRRIRMKQWILLALRVLAVALLALALARPFLPTGSVTSGNQAAPQATGILIDNSPSMDQIDESGPYLEQVKRIIRELADQAGRDDLFYLEVTNGEPLNLPPLSPVAAVSRLSEIVSVNSGNYTADRLSRLADRINQSPLPEGRLFLMSDGQQTQFDGIGRSTTDYTVEGDRINGLQILTVGHQSQPNVGIQEIILSHVPVSREQPTRLSVSVRNYGNSPIENYFISVESSGSVGGQHPVSLAAGESASYLFEVVPSDDAYLTGRVILEGDELVFDNSQTFSIHLPESRNILILRESGSQRSTFRSYLEPMLEAATGTTDRLNIVSRSWGEQSFEDLQSIDAIVLDGVRSLPDYAVGELLEFVSEGGGVMLLPSADGDMNSYNQLLERTSTGYYSGVTGSYGSFRAADRVATLQEGHPVLEEVFDKTDDEQIRVSLPDLYYYYTIAMTSSPGISTILASETGAPLLVDQRFGSGRMIVSALGADPGWSDFPVQPLFAPLFYRTLLYAASGGEAALNRHVLGSEFRTTVAGSVENVMLDIEGEEIVPERELTSQGVLVRYSDDMWTPGFVTVHSDESVIIAVNQHTMESDFRALSNRELEELFENHFNYVSAMELTGNESERAEQLQSAGLGKELWFWFILGAIMILLLETIISRFFKAESIN